MGHHCLSVISLMVMNLMLHGGHSQRTPAGERHVKETFLAGSEFEESLMSHLLNSTSLVNASDEVTSLLTSSNQTYTLASPDKPFEFVDRKYFFSKEKFTEWADSDNTTAFSYTCFYNTTNDEGLFSQIYFPDGEPISEVVFGCESNKECCGMKCCGDDVLINIIIVGAISAALLFLLFCNIIIGFKKRRDKNRRQEGVKNYQTDTINTTELGTDVISPDQIHIEDRHPSHANGSAANPNMIETLPNENPGKKR